MPITPTFPGVYIEEVPSGVRTIVGVATSITAFIGRAKRGPVNKAVTINSYADFERTFGGLDLNSKMSYAVRDFYLNGGGQAVIARLYRAESGSGQNDANLVPLNQVSNRTNPLIIAFPPVIVTAGTVTTESSYRPAGS